MLKSAFVTPTTRIQRIVSTAFAMDHPFYYLAREAMVRGVGPMRGTTIIGHYTFNGIGIEIHHGTSDHSIFSESFYMNLYSIPAEVRRVLGSQALRIMDLGGNVGWYPLLVAVQRLSVSDLLAFEADPGNYLRYNNMLKSLGRDWTVINAFAGTENGSVTFATGNEAFGAKTVDGSGESITSIDIIPLLSGFDLVKMDIEGGEWEILTDPRFATAIGKAIVLEYHPYLCPGSDARGEAERLLGEAGMTVVPVVHDDRKGHGMLWGYRDDRSQVGA